MDVFTKEKRSDVMSRISSRDTSPELAFEAWLAANGVSYWKHPPLPGSPDFWIPFSNACVFVDGCFWHGCPAHYRPPRTRKKYWLPKIDANRRRDRRASRALRLLGFRVFRVWEHHLKPPLLRSRL